MDHNTSTMKALIEQLWPEKGHLNEDQRDFLIDLLVEKKPQYCLETGYCTGRSSLTTIVACGPQKLISIDMQKVEGRLTLSDFPTFRFIQGKSQEILNDEFFNTEYPKGIDYAFIDGDHSYEGCLNDLKTIYPRMNPGGVMVIDDYKSGPPNGGSIPDVDAAVNNFIKARKIVIQVWNEKGKGFAVIRKDQE